MGITEKLRELIPNGDGYNSEFAHTMEAAAIEIERLRQGSDVLREELKEMSVIRGIDDRFGGRLALMLECAILNPNGYFDDACALLDEYKAEWEKVNPSPPTFMGEPIPSERLERFRKFKTPNDQVQARPEAVACNDGLGRTFDKEKNDGKGLYGVRLHRQQGQQH